MLSGRPLLATAADRRYLVERPVASTIVRGAEAELNTLLLGDRGMGKTSLLHDVENRLREASGPQPIYLDGARIDDATTTVLAIRDALMGPRSAVSDGLRSSTLALVPTTVELRNEEALRVIRELADDRDGTRAIVLLDDPRPEVAHQLFGRLRDELWQTGLTWVVAGDHARRGQYLTPPADAFFEQVVELTPLTADEQVELVRRRAEPASGTGVAGVILESGNPRALLAALRDAARPEDAGAALKQRAERQRRAERLGRLAGLMLAEIEDGAEASAADAAWLDRFGVSRQRAQQVLSSLARVGLVDIDQRPGSNGRPRNVYRRLSSNT